MNTEHTPGPYFVDDGMIRISEQAEMLLRDVGTDREWIAIGPGDEDTPTRPAEVVALCHPDNAPLLAAAPELLAAIREFVRCANEAIRQGRTYRDDGQCMRLARAALAKAEGP